ncbi:hypothetical protein Pint_34888 [Pistacia integerrima]|uniref:Uncharacterized protein n=1 Tax=Pistacia integerrima TaxID=434235 RepID=A0ACC0Y1K0_9ROSI|nr:hypothetical protein Pint_34888 [Pistacia integerrima]
MSLVKPPRSTLGGHLARRLLQAGVTDVIGCCNELNAGYAADGYARSRGVGACVVTFTVGGLSVLNAVAGAYAENLPVICIVGGPNTNDYGTNKILHHTIGLPDFSQELRISTAELLEYNSMKGKLKNHGRQPDQNLSKNLDCLTSMALSVSLFPVTQLFR